MPIPDWQIQEPLTAIFFDCDGTLTAIEGVNQLASLNGVLAPVAVLTEQAMGCSGINLDLYEQRLNLIAPTENQLALLGEMYLANMLMHAAAVITIFKRLNKAVYLVSAGLMPAVAYIGDALHIPHEDIFAVDIKFDEQGRYKYFDRHSPLVHNEGKRAIIKQFAEQHPRSMLVGDGLNDVSAADLVTRFIGFGGVFFRDNIRAMSDFYIYSKALSPLLPLCLTANEVQLLTPAEKIIYDYGYDCILQKQVQIKT